MSDTTRSFVTLDGLRGIAAVAVVTRHAPDFFTPLFESYLAVDFFFALSGFVLAHAYGDRLRRGMSAAQFMGLRIIRLYPLYFLGLLIPLAFAAKTFTHGGISSAGLTDLFFAVLFLPSTASPTLFPLNSPAWSLFFELVVNAVFGLIARHLQKLSLLLIVSFSGLALLFVVNFCWIGFGGAGRGAMDAGAQWCTIGAGAVRVAFSFFAGVLVYRVWKAWHLRINVPSIVVLAALAAILVANPPQKYQAAFDLVATLLVFPAIIFLGASSVPSWPRLFRWIGAISYAVYILQAPIYELIQRGAARLMGESLTELPWTCGAAFVVFVLGAATVADRYFDRPIREVLSGRFLTCGKEPANRGASLA